MYFPPVVFFTKHRALKKRAGKQPHMIYMCSTPKQLLRLLGNFAKRTTFLRIYTTNVWNLTWMGFDLFGQPDEVLLAWGGETPSKRQGKEKLKEMKRQVGQNSSFCAAETRVGQNQRLGWESKCKHKKGAKSKTHKFELVVNTRWPISKLLIIGNVRLQRLWLCLQTGGGAAFLHHSDFLKHPDFRLIIRKYFHRLISSYW